MSTTSYHYAVDRQERNATICQIGIGNTVDTFVVDSGHPNGPELHCVTDKAIVLVYNQKTNKFITALIARPKQLKKLYATRGRKPPGWLLKKAHHNNRHGLNTN
jgi:hypothetical protein